MRLGLSPLRPVLWSKMQNKFRFGRLFLRVRFPPIRAPLALLSVEPVDFGFKVILVHRSDNGGCRRMHIGAEKGWVRSPQARFRRLDNLDRSVERFLDCRQVTTKLFHLFPAEHPNARHHEIAGRAHTCPPGTRGRRPACRCCAPRARRTARNAPGPPGRRRSRAGLRSGYTATLRPAQRSDRRMGGSAPLRATRAPRRRAALAARIAAALRLHRHLHRHRAAKRREACLESARVGCGSS